MATTEVKFTVQVTAPGTLMQHCTARTFQNLDEAMSYYQSECDRINAEGAPRGWVVEVVQHISLISAVWL